MKPRPANLLREVFLEAAEMDDPQARAAYLDEACAGDESLRRRVEALLAAEVQAGGPPLETPPPAPVGRDPALGSLISYYKLLQQIGEGGCGVVFMAEQEKPVRRKVALKVIKLGMDTKQVVARFEAERQALAMMDHPNIARVFDAGATNTGRPYFVMELVRGIKITDYCDEHQLSTRQRLDLFMQVCHAVQHAHQKGIIHRDLKPSNVLLTELDGRPLPKIIDFGIAKAVEGRLTDQTLFTAFEQFIGTPAYMSPEQAALNAADVDTRSDIYSLGVLLYELLTGQTPFDTKTLLSSGLDEMRRTIREAQPQRPSTLLRQTSSATSRSGSHSRSRSPLLAADLDWIVMKCLEKDRRRRYETANGLAMDVQRHLDNQPVLARPPSRLYEFQKSVRRHKFGFAATAAIILVLLVGVLVSSWQATRATHAEKQAVAAQAGETKLRQQAQAQELAARRRAYAANMLQAKDVLNRDNLGTARTLLEQQKPEAQQQDLRGWEWRYLWKQTRSDALFTLGQVPGEINSLAASADNRWLAVGLRHRGGLWVWDLRKREEPIRLTEGEERIHAVFSPAEPLLAFAGVSLLDSGQQQSTLHLWDGRTREMVDETPLDGECAGLAFSEDGRMLVTSTEAGTGSGYITLWGVRGGTELARSRSYPCQQSIFPAATCFTATPDLRLAAFTYGPANQRGKMVCVVDLRAGNELWSFPAAQEIVTALAFSSDGKILATARGIGEKPPVINLWDVDGKREIGTPLLGHRQPPFSMVFWPDGTRLASASGDKTIRIWDVATGECVDVLRGQDNSLRRLALLPESQTLVSGDSGGRICFWDTSVTHPGQPHVTIPATVLAWCFTPDSKSVLTLDAQGEVAQWTGTNFQNKAPLMKIASSLFRNNRIHQFSQDGRLLALGSTHGVLQVWDLSDHRLRYQWTNTTGLVVPLEFRSHDNTLFTWSESNNELHQWDLATRREMACLPIPPWPCAHGFSPDGQVAIETDESGNVWRLSLADNSKLKMTPAIFEGSGVAFSPDGRLLAISSFTGSVIVWDTITWSVQATNLSGGCSVVFSPDGTRLATGGGFTLAVNLWDTSSWKQLLTLSAENDGFSRTAFSSDGNSIGSLNMAGTLYLWSAPSWEEIAAAERDTDEPTRRPQLRAR